MSDTSIHDLEDATAELVANAYDDFRQKSDNFDTNVSKALSIVFRLSVEYFFCTRNLLDNKQTLTSGAIIRLGIENLADLNYLLSNPDKYVEDYLKSTKKYHDVMVKSFSLAFKSSDGRRGLKQAARWTNASIDDRIKFSGDAFVNLYDMLSYFSHPTPGTSIFLNDNKLGEGLRPILRQMNCVVVLYVLNTAIDECTFLKVDRNYIESIIEQLNLGKLV